MQYLGGEGTQLWGKDLLQSQFGNFSWINLLVVTRRDCVCTHMMFHGDFHQNNLCFISPLFQHTSTYYLLCCVRGHGTSKHHLSHLDTLVDKIWNSVMQTPASFCAPFLNHHFVLVCLWQAQRVCLMYMVRAGCYVWTRDDLWLPSSGWTVCMCVCALGVKGWLWMHFTLVWLMLRKLKLFGFEKRTTTLFPEVLCTSSLLCMEMASWTCQWLIGTSTWLRSVFE